MNNKPSKPDNTNAAPSPNGASDKDPQTGRFLRGNQAAAGKTNSMAAKVKALKETVLVAVTENRLHAVIMAMLEKAMKGDVAAARLVMEYALGPAREALVQIAMADKGEGLRKTIIVMDERGGRLREPQGDDDGDTPHDPPNHDEGVDIESH